VGSTLLADDIEFAYESRLLDEDREVGEGGASLKFLRWVAVEVVALSGGDGLGPGSAR
jgi:hypothetical protein